VPYDTQGSSDWNTDILPFNQRLPFTPAAIAVPTSIPHVQGAIACGTQFGYKINAKGGGHSYASHSLGGENGHLVIELDRMYNVTLNSTTNVAVVQAGARLGHVLTQLDSQGKRAFSTGTCPGVGVSGHALHGGYGFSSRKYGLATDWIVGAQMVLANGTLIHVSATENPDIFWAIRGAGSNFGVIVSYEFNTFAQPSQVTYFTVTANWNANNMQANMLALENYTRYSMPAELTMRYSINPGGQNEFEGMYYGNKTGLQTALAPLFNNVSPKLSLGSSTTTTFMGAFDYYAYTPATDPTYPYNTVSPIEHPDAKNLHTDKHQQENFYAKSLVVNHLNGTAAQAFVNYIFTQGPSNTRQWWLQLDLHGGANSAVTNGDFSTSSYAHRDKIFLMQFYDRVYSGSYPSTGFSFLNGWVSSITNNLNASDWGMYINYADSTLDRATAQSAYYGASLPRLQALKAALDPSEVFYYPSGSLQAIAS